MTSKSQPRRAVKVVKPVKAVAKAKAGTPAKARAKATVSAPKSKAEVNAKSPATSLRREVLRKNLLARRQEVMKEVDELLANRMSDEYQRRVDSAPDLGDQALLDTERVRDISILEMRNRMREQIDEALAKLEEGSYGLCADCHVEISERRLHTVPFARRCVECQAKQELLEKIELEPEEHER